MIKRNTYVSPYLIYSADIPTLNYTTDYDRLCVSVYKATADYDVIFTTELCAVDGKVNIYDIKPLVEQYMKDKDMAYLEFNIDVENEGGEEVLITPFKVLYCSFKPSEAASNFARFHFLTSLNSKILYYYDISEDELCFYAEKDKEINIEKTILYTSVDGELKKEISNYSYTVQYTGIDSLWVDLADIWYELGCNKGAVLHSITYKVNERMFTYYLVDKVPDLYLSFANAFNIREVITINGKTTTVIKREKSEAVCGGVTRYYDCNFEKLYEFESERLTTAEVKLFEEFVTSDKVLLYDSTAHRILITDFTYEVADDDAEKNIVKFTWRYADNRRAMPIKYERNMRIFTEQFDKTFQ